MTNISFCQWVINDLHELPNEALEPGFPRQTSVKTAKKKLHKLEHKVLYQKKTVYIGGHEREDVCKVQKFIRKMVAMCFINEDNAPTPEVKLSLPMDLECPPPEMHAMKPKNK